MSDFAGLWRLDGRPVDKADIDRLVQGLEGRGIAAPRIWRAGPVAMVHRQHVFTPEDADERMPWVGDSGAVLAADIRLDERDALADSLGMGGLAATDGRLALRAFERWGTDAPPRLYGDWSLALWQPAQQRLLLARDAQISRSLFFHRGSRLIAFATRMRPLLALPEIPIDLDELAIADSLILNSDEPERTHYKAIERVPQGCMAVLDASDVRRISWWSMPEPGSLRFKRYEDVVEAANDVVDRAVAGASRAIGPIGSCLTGGFDSAAVTLSAHRQLTPGRLVAMTRVPGRPIPRDTARECFDESPRAAAVVARHPGLDWHPVPADGGDWGEWDQRRWHLESGIPTANMTNSAWFFPLYRFLAERGGRVLLNGEFGNYFFSFDGGTAELALLRQGRLLAACRLVRDRSRHENAGLIAMARHWLLSPYEPLWLRNRRKGLPPEPWGFFAALNPAFATDVDMRGRLDMWRYRGRSGVRLPKTRQARDMVYRNPGLCDWYVNTRALSGIDQRSPLASRQVVEFFGALPQEDFIRDGVPRALARDVLRGHLPDEVLGGRSIGRQTADWFTMLSAQRPALMQAMPKLRKSPLASRIVDLDRLQCLLDDWPTDVEAAQKRTTDYFFVLVRGMETALFLAWKEGGNS